MNDSCWLISRVIIRRCNVNEDNNGRCNLLSFIIFMIMMRANSLKPNDLNCHIRHFKILQ